MKDQTHQKLDVWDKNNINKTKQYQTILVYQLGEKTHKNK